MEPIVSNFFILNFTEISLQTFNFQSLKLVNSKKFYPISYIEHTMQLFNRSRHLLSKHTNSSSFSTTPFPFFKSSAAEWLSENLPSSGDLHSHQATHKRFPDDAQYRIEIPSTEGLESLKSVIEEAKKYNVTVHRVSQGSGINMMPKHETLEMLKIGKAEGMEVCLFVGPRNAWDISAVARTDAGRNAVSGHRGMDQVVFALEDVMRGVDMGLRSILVNDWGLLWAIDEMKKQGKLPSNLVQKISVQMGPPNALTASLLERTGAGTINPPTDLTIPQLASIREATDVPLDIYVEAPDNFGGFVRHYEVPQMVRSCSPMYIKLGLKKHGDIYPSGGHLEAHVCQLSRERVRRARIVLDLMDEYAPDLIMSEKGAKGLGIPEL